MNTAPLIRYATSADLECIAAILAESPTAPQWTMTEFADILAQPDVGQPLLRRIWMSDSDGREFTGFAVASIIRSVYPADAELESLAVAAASRRKGIASALVQAVSAWAAELGANCLRLEVRASNASAIRLYDRRGFRQTGLRRGYYSHPVEDALCMERTIPRTVPADAQSVVA